MAALCCCCCSGENADDERRPLLQPPDCPEISAAVSARTTRPPSTANVADTATHSGRLVMRRVGLSEWDQRFSDVAETFNEQQDHYGALSQYVAHLRQSYGCNHDNTLLLSECVKKIRDEHGQHYRLTLQIKGYHFGLTAVPLDSGEDRGDAPPPQRLQAAQDALRGASQAAKMTVSFGTKVLALTEWLLQNEERVAGLVATAATNLQEQWRLLQNLQACLREVRRAEELSLRYKQRAGEVLNEAAQLAEMES